MEDKTTMEVEFPHLKNDDQLNNLDFNLLKNLDPALTICENNMQVKDTEIYVVVMPTSGEYFCTNYLTSFDNKIVNLKNSLLDFEQRIDPQSSYGLEAIDHITNSVNQVLDSNRSMMWRAVKNTVPWQDYPLRSEIQELVTLSHTCANTASIASQLINYISVLVPLPEHEIETDDTGNIIINWTLDSRSYEWTIAKSDDPWPMLRVYEFTRKRADRRQPPSISTWHNAKSLGERFISIIKDDQKYLLE